MCLCVGAFLHKLLWFERRGGAALLLHSKFNRPQQLFARLSSRSNKCWGLPKCYIIIDSICRNRWSKSLGGKVVGNNQLVNKAKSYTHSKLHKGRVGDMMMHSKFKRPQQPFARPISHSIETCCGLPKSYIIDLAV